MGANGYCLLNSTAMAVINQQQVVVVVDCSLSRLLCLL